MHGLLCPMMRRSSLEISKKEIASHFPVSAGRHLAKRDESRAYRSGVKRRYQFRSTNEPQPMNPTLCMVIVAMTDLYPQFHHGYTASFLIFFPLVPNLSYQEQHSDKQTLTARLMSPGI